MLVKVNEKNLSAKQVKNLFERKRQTIETNLNVKLFRFIIALLKAKQDFNVKSFTNKSDKELKKILTMLKLPETDRSNKSNLGIKTNNKPVSQDFSKLLNIKIE